MKKRHKRALIILGALAVLGFVLVNVLAYKHAYAMRHFTTGGPRTVKPEALGWGQRIRILFVGVNVPRPESDLSPGRLRPGAGV